MKPLGSFPPKPLLLVLAAAFLSLLGPWWARRTPEVGSPAAPASLATPAASPSAAVVAAENPAPKANPAATSPSAFAHSGPVQRPLAVARESAMHAWTAEDARLPAVIERIAHNADEAGKMLEENNRIHRRQLVYRKDPAGAAILRARLTGEPVRRLTLPGLDGQELEFEIDHADLSPSGQSGTLTGHLADQLDSMVTLSFQFGIEAFTVLSPEADLYLLADPREPGELILKSFDPATYSPGRCGTSELMAGK